MTYLSDEERSSLQAAHKLAADARAKRAGELVNPASGLANDYLNRFNEIVMLIEQLPVMPELIDDINAWRPISYLDYFRTSILPGSVTALEAYDKLDVRFRKSFETIVEELDRRSTGSVVAVRRKFKTQADDNGTGLADVCERAGANIREVLEKAAQLVNHGAFISADAVQARTDELMRRLSSQRVRG